MTKSRYLDHIKMLYEKFSNIIHIKSYLVICIINYINKKSTDEEFAKYFMDVLVMTETKNLECIESCKFYLSNISQRRLFNCIKSVGLFFQVFSKTVLKSINLLPIIYNMSRVSNEFRQYFLHSNIYKYLYKFNNFTTDDEKLLYLILLHDFYTDNIDNIKKICTPLLINTLNIFFDDKTLQKMISLKLALTIIKNAIYSKK